jgi:hypothetical protein
MVSNFAALCVASGLPKPVPEYRFVSRRRWRFDWAFVREKIAIEQEGGAWLYGRHNRPASFLKDMVKYNEAAIQGWLILRLTPEQFARGDAIILVRRLLENRRAEVAAPADPFADR